MSKRIFRGPVHWCAEQVYQGRAGLASCQRRGTVYGIKTKYGVKKTGWWCKQHSPQEEAKRKAAWEARWRANAASDARRYEIEAAEAGLMAWARRHRAELPTEAHKYIDSYERNVKKEAVK